MIMRSDYIKAITPFIDQPLVKILAGVRRCGKSTIFEMLAGELRSRGIPKDSVIQRRYTEMDIAVGITAREMYEDILGAISQKGRCYLLLDEIQEVEGWERAVNSLFEGYNVDIYVTGSNSRLMSSEISTYLTGRFVSIPVFPLFGNTLISGRAAVCPTENCWSSISVSEGFLSSLLEIMRREALIRL